MTQSIDHNTLEKLAAAGAVTGAHIVGQRGGWALMVRDGLLDRPLAAQRSRQTRIFRKLETLVAYLKGLGIARFEVDAANYEPEIASKRPDRAEALKRAHEAAAYENWFRTQVQASFDDPRPSVPDKEARARFALRKAALRHGPQ